MKEFSVIMSLVDFVPVILFMTGAVVLQRLMYEKMSKGQFALFAAGTVDVIMAGGLKALYKLLYALGICDFAPLNSIFFPVQSFGFLLAGLGMIAMVTKRPDKFMTRSVAPVLWTGTFLFVSFMCIGLGLMDAGLAICAGKKKKPAIIVILVVSFFCSLCMGYLSGKDFDKAIFNWIGEFINILGQGCFMVAAFMLNKAEKEG